MHFYLCTSIICVSFFYQANAIGRSAKTVREFLEKHYTEEVADSDDETIKLAIKALLEVCKFLWFMIFYLQSNRCIWSACCGFLWVQLLPSCFKQVAPILKNSVHVIS